VKGKLVNGVGSQYSHTTLEHDVSSITNADAHTSVASGRLNGCPCRFKWTRPFQQKTKSGFCMCAITFQMHYTHLKHRFITVYSTKWQCSMIFLLVIEYPKIFIGTTCITLVFTVIIVQTVTFFQLICNTILVITDLTFHE
jgi:hypothetical protein